LCHFSVVFASELQIFIDCYQLLYLGDHLDDNIILSLYLLQIDVVTTQRCGAAGIVEGLVRS